MATQEQIATALLEVELPSSSVAGLCLEMAKISNPVRMPTPPDASSVEKVMSKGWAKIATAVSSGTKEFLGKRLAKHSSLQVRRLLAEETVDEETLRMLHVWAVEKDPDTLAITMRRLEPEWLVERIESGARYSYRLLQMLASSIVARRQDLFARARAADPEFRLIATIEAAPALAEGRIPNWDLASVLAADPPADRERIAPSACRDFTGVVDASLMETMSLYPESLLSLEKIGFPRASGFTPDAARALITIEPLHALQVLGTDWDLSLYETFVGTGRLEVLSVLLSHPKTLASYAAPEISRAILATKDATSGETYRPVLLSRNLLSELPYLLDTDVLLQYLRHTEEAATWAWLTGQFAQKPRPGEISRLLGDPGFAFGWEHNYAATSQRSKFQSTSIESISYEAARRIATLVPHEWCDEFVDSLGSAAFDCLIRAHHGGGTAYIARRFTRELGDDRDLWRDALAYFPKSTLSIGKSLNAIRKLSTARKGSESPI